MKKHILLSSILTIFSFGLFYSQLPTKYLFIGNSLIKYKNNHTLKILNNFIADKDSVRISNYTINGSRLFMLLRFKKIGPNELTLESNIRNADLYNLLKSNNFDYSIVQQDSEFNSNHYPPPFDSIYQTLFSKSFNIFDSIAKETNTKTILLENYISFLKLKKKGDFRHHCDSVYQAIEDNVLILKKVDSNLKIIPSGYLVKEFILKYPRARTKLLFSMHPHKNIQYLLASLLYIELTGKNPICLKYNYKINPSFAKEIRTFVWDYYSRFHDTNS